MLLSGEVYLFVCLFGANALRGSLTPIYTAKHESSISVRLFFLLGTSLNFCLPSVEKDL